jgi:D-alanyl-D-alanine carboxypeptidase/D-alanyl-D-alanine-endopeptidase (penicillin-binding protein 4)
MNRNLIKILIFLNYLFVNFLSLNLDHGLASIRSFNKSNASTEGTAFKKLIHDKIEKIRAKNKIKSEHLGMIISSGEGDNEKIIFESSPDKKMIPASITKIATAAVTLKKIPPGQKIKTSLWRDGEIENGVLKGNLILKGGGDPSFVSENLWYLVNAFTRSEIKIIEGNILVDDSLFDSIRFDPSRQEERVDRAYDAPTGAMSFNWNSVNIFVRPAEKGGELAKVFIDPENEYIRLINKVKTVEKGTADISVDRDPDKEGPGDVIIVKGVIPKNSNEVTVFKNITNPDLWSGYNLKSFLKQRNIQVKGNVKAQKINPQAILVAESESKGIEQILGDMNKFSNNYVAEMLAKNIGAQIKTPGSIKVAMDEISSYLISLGAQKNDFELLNPSGLTRDNKVTARVLWRVLNDMKNQFAFHSEFMTSLPIAGIDGTLKKRMKGTPGERLVRAKTGFLTNVVSLAGYLSKADGTIMTFVFMFNGQEDEAKVKQFYDSICLSLIDS